jgi:hypothetical protein
MNSRLRRRFLQLLALYSVPELASLPGRAQTPFSEEPNYTLMVRGVLKLGVSLRVDAAPGGGSVVRLTPRPPAPGSSELRIAGLLESDARKRPTRCRITLHLGRAVVSIQEATRQESGGGEGYRVRTPGEQGVLPFGATLVVPLFGELFLGRMYDWKRGGEQNFAMLVEQGVPGAEMVTLKLTADGMETVDLVDGPVKARKLKYAAPAPHLPKEQHTGTIYVGPLGEVIRCDNWLFGIPIKTKGPAAYEENGRRFAVRFGDGKPRSPVVLLRADRAGAGWAVTLEIENGVTIASGAVDERFRMTRMETPWHSGKFRAEVKGNAVHYSVEPGRPEDISTPTGRALFLPHWFATDLWEGPGGAFADLAVGEKREASYLPLTPGDDNTGGCVLERLPDVTAPRPVSPGPVRVYRFTQTPPESAPGSTATPGQTPRSVNSVYTDGRRLLAFLGSDGGTIIRDGAETWAATLPKPVVK